MWMSTLSNLPQSKTRTEYSHSPICIFNKDNKTSNPTMMNIRMNFDLLNHKIERLNNMMINTSSNDYDTFDLKSNDSFRTFEKRNNKNPNYLNSVTTTVTNDNSPFKNSYSQRKEFSPSIDNYSFRYSNNYYENKLNKSNENNFKNNSINNISNNYINNQISKDDLSINSANKLLNPPEKNKVQNFTYKNMKYMSNNNINNYLENNTTNELINNDSYPIKVNIKTVNQKKINRSISQFKNKNYNSRLLTEGDISEMINNLHEKTKKFNNLSKDGLDRFRRLKLNQRMNNFNKRIITGNWQLNILDKGFNNTSSYLRNYSNNSNKSVPITYNQSIKNTNNSNLNDINNKDNTKIKVNKVQNCTTKTCTNCKKKNKRINQEINIYDNKKLIEKLKSQNSNKPIQISEKNYNNYQENYNENINNNINDLINEYKEKKNENKNLLNSLHFDKPIINFGGLENIDNSSYYDSNKNNNYNSNIQNKRNEEELERLFEEIKKGKHRNNFEK